MNRVLGSAIASLIFTNLAVATPIDLLEIMRPADPGNFRYVEYSVDRYAPKFGELQLLRSETIFLLQYSPEHRLARRTEWNSEYMAITIDLAYEYDEGGRLVREHRFSNGRIDNTILYFPNADTSTDLIIPDGADSWILRFYDPENRITRESRFLRSEEQNRIIIMYDDHGRLAEREAYNSYGSLSSRTSYGYIDEGPHEEISYRSDGSIRTRLTYEYDDKGRQIAKYSVGEGGNTTAVNKYEYSDHGVLTYAGENLNFDFAKTERRFNTEGKIVSHKSLEYVGRQFQTKETVFRYVNGEIDTAVVVADDERDVYKYTVVRDEHGRISTVNEVLTKSSFGIEVTELSDFHRITYIDNVNSIVIRSDEYAFGSGFRLNFYIRRSSVDIGRIASSIEVIALPDILPILRRYRADTLLSGAAAPYLEKDLRDHFNTNMENAILWINYEIID